MTKNPANSVPAAPGRSRLSDSQREQINWYVTRAFLQKREAERYFSTGKYAESVVRSLDSIEYAVKSMCKMTDVTFNATHAISSKTLIQLSEKVGHKWRLDKKDTILQALPTIVSYTDEQRSIFRYGVENTSIPPISPVKLVSRSYAETALRDARQICQIMHEIHARMKWALND